MDPTVSLAPGPRFQLYRVSACQRAEVGFQVTLTRPGDRLVTEPPRA